MRWLFSFGLIVAFADPVSAVSGAEPDFASEIQPLLESACVRCHQADHAESGLRLDSRAAALKGGDRGPALVPGKPDESPLYTFMLLAADDAEFMPPADRPLDRSQTDRIRQWIAAGAKWPKDSTLTPQPRMHFDRHVQPILERQCLGCHGAEAPEGGLNLTSWQAAVTPGREHPLLTPFQPSLSSIYTTTIRGKDDELLMPPVDSGGPLGNTDTEKLRLWIAQGAVWPRDLTLKQRPKIEEWEQTPDTIELLEKIHRKIVDTAAQEGVAHKDYKAAVPLSKAPYEMIAIQGGEFLMGSPATEPHRSEIEGPQKKVRISPFWMGKFEVTWDEYEPFMATQESRAKNGARTDYDPQKHGLVDAVSQPTPAYTEMSFGMGQRGFPAISMTQHAANKYCQWLSAQTGHFYRLPTEAEWEYACRAGTTTAYSFGDDPSKLVDYGWFYDNANEKYQKVGKKKPNPWGLHDMHGNVMEWTADIFLPDYFEKLTNPLDPVFEPLTLYPRSVRGGGWDDDPEQLRSAARRGSDPTWKQKDPQLPKSIWYHTDAPWVGFRMVRPLKLPTVEELDFYWNSAVGKY